MKTTTPESKIKHPVLGLCSKLLLLIAVITLALSMFACGEPSDAESVRIVISNAEKTVEYKVRVSDVENAETGIDLLQHLEDDGKIDLEYQDSAYGAYVTKVGHIEEVAANGIYIGFWTSYEPDFDVSQYATTVTYNGEELTSSGVGISSMHYEEGTIIYIGEIKY